MRLLIYGVSLHQKCTVPATGLRGRGRNLTSKAQVAGEVAAAATSTAATSAAALPKSTAPKSSQLPAATLASAPIGLPSALSAEGDSSNAKGPEGSPLKGSPQDSGVLPAPSGKAGKGQGELFAKGSTEGRSEPAAPLSRAAKRQKEADEKAAEGKAQLEGVAKLAHELQPTGSTLSTQQVRTKVRQPSAA